jgi:hypothetical protein
MRPLTTNVECWLIIFQDYDIFLCRKNGNFRKMMLRLEVPSRIPDQLHLPPLDICVGRQSLAGRSDSANIFDALVEMRWDNQSFRFGAEYIRRSTPKAVDVAAKHVSEQAQGQQLYPLLVAPYFSEERLLDLKQRAVSGIDLCGNGIVVVPPKLFVFRSGSPNRFSSSTPIKNIYRGVSSLVARVFLLRPYYQTVNDIHEEIVRRGGTIVLSTVSKALHILEDDLIVGRERRAIRLLQPEKLLDRLVAHFEPPQVQRAFAGKATVAPETLRTAVVDAAGNNGIRLATTGVGSTGRYAVIAKEDTISLYCTDRDRLLRQLPVVEEPFFPGFELLETSDETVYFDMRYQDGYPWASPLQTYFELMAGEQRSRQTADQVRSLILQELAEQTRA